MRLRYFSIMLSILSVMFYYVPLYLFDFSDRTSDEEEYISISVLYVVYRVTSLVTLVF